MRPESAGGKVNRFMFWNALAFSLAPSAMSALPYHSFADPGRDKLLFLTVAPLAWRPDIWNCLLTPGVAFSRQLYNLESF